MIPTLLVLGLVTGGILGFRRPNRLAAVGIVASLLWGLGVGLADGSAGTFVAGAVLAMANVVVGAALGVLPHALVSSVAHRRTTRPRGSR